MIYDICVTLPEIVELTLYNTTELRSCAGPMIACRRQYRAARQRYGVGCSRRPMLAIAFIPLFANWKYASRRGDTTTRDFAHDLLNSVEPYAVIVTAGDNDTFPLWYAQQVEGIRKDVVIAVTSLLNTDWYARQMVRAPVSEYDEAQGPAIYRGKRWPKPTEPPVRMTLDEVDHVPPYVRLTNTRLFEAGNIRRRSRQGISRRRTSSCCA